MSGATLSFNREMAMEFGITAALIYQELERKQFYWKEQDKLVDGFFWCDQAAIADWILVHNNTASKAIKQLEEAGLIERKVSYRPGSTITTTWWKVKDGVTPGVTKNVTPRSHKNSDSYIKATTEAITVEESQNEVSGASSERIKPAQLYSRIHSFFGGRHDRRKAMVAAIGVLQTELSDETIILGCQEIAAHPTFKTKEGDEITWTLSMLLSRDAAGLDRTADVLMRAAEKREAREKKESKEKKVKYSAEECY